MAKKERLAYIGDCGKKADEVLRHINQNANCQLMCVCDTNLNQGLLCAERFETGFVEDAGEVMNDEAVTTVVFEATERFPKQRVVDALCSGKSVLLLLSPATFSQMRAAETALLLAQKQRGAKGGFTVIDHESASKWLNRMPIGIGKLGRLLNIYIGFSFSVDSVERLEWERYEACRLLYDLLGTPEESVVAQNQNIDSAVQRKGDFTGAVAFKFPSGAIAAIVIGGLCREKEICLYGTNACVIMAGKTVNYRLNSSDWITEQTYSAPDYLSDVDDFLNDLTGERAGQPALGLGMPAYLAGKFPFVR